MNSSRFNCSPRWLAGLSLCVAFLISFLFMSRAAFAGATLNKGRVDLAWTAQADPASADDTNYSIYRGANGAALTYFAYSPKNTPSYSDGAVSNGNSYTYRVEFNRTTHDFYADPDGVVRDHPTTSTIVVLNESVSVQLEAPVLTAQLDKGKVVLSWNAISQSTGNYNIFRAVDGAAFTNTPFTYTTNSITTFTDGSVLNGHTYSYRVAAYNNAGLGLPSNTKTVPVQLEAPELAAQLDKGKVVLSWNAISQSSGGYSIYRAVNGAAFTNTPYAYTPNSTTTFTDTSVLNGHTYAYNVKATNNAGDGLPSNTKTVPVQLEAPTLQVSAVSGGLLLQWTSVAESSGGYSIYRAVDGAAFTNTPYSYTNNSTTSFRDGGVDYGYTYAYYVVASNNAGNGLPSNVEDGKLSPVEPNSKAGVPYQCACPKVGGVPAGEDGPSFPDPVNVSTGGESNEPGPDLVVYNPSGPQVAFQRMGRGNQAKRGYGSPGMPAGWVHNYDIVIEAPQGSSSWTSGLVLGYPNGSSEALTAQVDGAGVPTGEFAAVAGAPYFVQGVPSSTVGRWQSITVTWSDQSKWEFTPYHAGRLYALSRIYDRMGRSLALYYSGVTRTLTSVRNWNTGAILLSLTYGDYGMLSTVTDPYGRKVAYTVGRTGGIAAVLLQTVSQVAATSVPAPPARWGYGYEVRNGRPFLTTVSVPSPTGTGTATSTITYDSQNRVSSLTDATGKQRTLTYQAGGTVIEDRDAAGTLASSYRLNFDSDRRNTGTTLSGGATNSVSYDDAGNPRRPTTVTSADNKTVTYTYDQYGNPLTVTDARGVVTSYAYNYTAFRLGRLVSVQQSGRAATTFTYYEPSGLVASVTSPSPTGSGTVTHSVTYDALGNVLTVVGPGNNATGSVTTTLNYTQDGTYSQAAALGQPLKVTDNLGRVTHFRYDAMGRVTSATDHAGNTTTTQYNLADQPTLATLPATGQTGTGNGVAESIYLYPGGPLLSSRMYNEAGSLTRQVDTTYDAEGRLLSVTGGTEPASFQYDGAGRLVRRYDGNNNLQSEYFYNADGRLAGEHRAAGGGVFHERAYLYDTAGRVTQRTDGVAGQTAGRIIATYAYNDPEGLLTAVQYLNAPARNVSLAYDSYGRLGTRTDGTGTQTYTYGELDQPLSVTTTYAGLPGQTLSYSYYPDGSRAGVGTSVGSFSFGYDAGGQPTALTNPFGETTGWSYLTNGWLASQTLGNGVSTAYTYNGLGQLKTLHNRTAAYTVLSQFDQMSYDGAGNRLSVTATVPTVAQLTGSTNYTYDLKNQLTQEASGLNGGFTSGFAYDGAGNPTLFKGQTRTYDAQNRRTGTGFAYDVQGNPTLYRGSTIVYTPEGQATSIGGLLTADYTAEGVRAWKQATGGSKTYFIYDGLVPIMELNAAGAVTAVNTFGAAGLVSRRTVTGAGAQSVFYLFDERGNTSVRLDAAGTVLSRHAADAYGGLLSLPAGAGSDDPYAGFGAQHGYYRDEETGLSLCTFRYYDQAEGRWLTPDPIGYQGGVNLYGYVANRPVNGSDPLGLASPGTDIFGLGITGLWVSGRQTSSLNIIRDWSGYMQRDPDLATQIQSHLFEHILAIRRQRIRNPIIRVDESHQITMGGGKCDFTGHGVLHTGTVRMKGTLLMYPNGSIYMKMHYTWIDSIDRRPGFDDLLGTIGWIVSMGQARDYDIRIQWNADAIYRPGVKPNLGWPYQTLPR